MIGAKATRRRPKLDIWPTTSDVERATANESREGAYISHDISTNAAPPPREVFGGLVRTVVGGQVYGLRPIRNQQAVRKKKKKSGASHRKRSQKGGSARLSVIAPHHIRAIKTGSPRAAVTPSRSPRRPEIMRSEANNPSKYSRRRVVASLQITPGWEGR